MSSHRRSLVLGPRAAQDFSDILLYTEQQWGKRQRASYKSALDRGLRQLIRIPGMDRPLDDLGPGLRVHQVRQRTIDYRVEDDTISVDGILHAQMDATHHLSIL
jgi:plasmid stabilization system protein ParE